MESDYILKSNIDGILTDLLTTKLHEPSTVDILINNPITTVKLRKLIETSVPPLLKQEVDMQVNLALQNIKFDAFTEAKKLLKNDYRLQSLVTETVNNVKQTIKTETKSGVSQIQESVKDNINKLLRPDIYNPIIEKPLKEFQNKCEQKLVSIDKHLEQKGEYIESKYNNRIDTLEKRLNENDKLTEYMHWSMLVMAPIAAASLVLSAYRK